MAEVIKFCLNVGSEATVEYIFEPWFHPPTAAKVFSCGFEVFKRFKLGTDPKVKSRYKSKLWIDPFWDIPKKA